MDELVDIVIEDDRWLAFGLEALALRAAAAAFDELALTGFSFCLMACDDARIATLNAEFRGKPLPTNVLSWPSEERGADADGDLPQRPQPGPDSELGDVAISYDTCEAEARTAGKPMADHVCHLLVHGVLHLLGYDHIRDGDAEVMEATEVRILARMGLSDPYSVEAP